MKKKLDKASLLTTLVIILLCVFFVVGFTYGLSTVMDMEGTVPPVVNEEGLTPPPQTADEALSFLNKALDKVKSEKPKTETGASFGIDGDSLDTDGSEQFRQVLEYIKGSAQNCLADTLEKPSTDFYEGAEKILRLPNIASGDINDFTCEYITYICPSCGLSSDEPLDECESCGCEKPYNLTYQDKYRITLNLRVDENVLAACFAPRTSEESLKLINDAVDGKAKLKKIDVEYTDLTIYFEVDRLTDKITKLSYRKGMNIGFDTADAFIGEWSKIKGGNVSFAMSESYDYTFTWPALTLNNHYVSIEPKGNDNLLATLTCDNPTEYDVTWKSSDESIVTVDNEGYFDAGKKLGRATITATYNFGDITYSDECIIDVKVSVDSLSMKDKKISLKAGETEKLTVKVKPSDATVKTLTWYTEDESIAYVDADGTVHAVKPGTVTVYCLSDDGYYKSSSEVTVV